MRKALKYFLFPMSARAVPDYQVVGCFEQRMTQIPRSLGPNGVTNLIQNSTKKKSTPRVLRSMRIWH